MKHLNFYGEDQERVLKFQSELTTHTHFMLKICVIGMSFFAIQAQNPKKSTLPETYWCLKIFTGILQAMLMKGPRHKTEEVVYES